MPLLLASILGASIISGGPAPKPRLPPHVPSAPAEPVDESDVAGRSLRNQLDRVDAIIRQAGRSGQLTDKEAAALRRERDQIATLQDRYANGGISEREAQELEGRISTLRDTVHAPGPSR